MTLPQLNPILWIGALSLTAACFLSSCSKESTDTSRPTEPPAATVSVNISQAEQAFWQATDQHLATALNASEKLALAITNFLDAPTQSTLANAQQTLQETKLKFRSLNSFTQLQQNAPEIFTDSSQILFRIQANPIQPGYLDRFGPYQYSGLVFDIGFGLTAESLIQQHGLTDSEEVVLGIYALEFMLMGEHGSRSYQDYIKATNLNDEHQTQKLSNLSEVPNNRRRTLLSLQSQQLITDLSELKAQLNSQSFADIQRWRALSPQQQISKIRTSLQGGLTQSLISLASIQDAISQNAPPKEGQAPALPATQLPAPQQAIERLSIDITALSSMTPYLSDIERNATNTVIKQSTELLGDIDPNNIEQSHKQLQVIYEQLKATL